MSTPWDWGVQGFREEEEWVLYLPVGDSLGVPLLSLPFAARLLPGATVACSGGGCGGFNFRGGRGRGGDGDDGADLFRPHLCRVAEDAAGRIESAGIHPSGGGGGGGGQVRAACARAGEGKGFKSAVPVLQGPFSIYSYFHPRSAAVLFCDAPFVSETLRAYDFVKKCSFYLQFKCHYIAATKKTKRT